MGLVRGPNMPFLDWGRMTAVVWPGVLKGRAQRG